MYYTYGGMSDILLLLVLSELFLHEAFFESFTVSAGRGSLAGYRTPTLTAPTDVALYCA